MSKSIKIKRNQTTYTNPKELYEAFEKHTKTNKKVIYLDAFGSRYTSDNCVNIINVMINPKSKNKVPCFITRSDINLPYSVWNHEEVAQHNQFLVNTEHEFYGKSLDDMCEHHLVLLNNIVPADGVVNTVVLDVDSKEELFLLYKNGCPIFELPYTLSSTKKLPHFYVHSDSFKQILGKSLDEPKALDIITNYVLEKREGYMYNYSGTYREYGSVEMSKWTGIPVKCFVHKDYEHIRQDKIDKLNGNPSVKIKHIYSKQKTEVKIDLNGKKVEPINETIPLLQLEKIMDCLDANDYADHTNWYKFARVIISMVDKNGEPEDFLKLLNKFYENDPKFIEKNYGAENRKTFVNFLNDPSSMEFYVGKQTGAEWLYDELFKKNRDKWIEYAFMGHRQIDPKIFDRLYHDEAIKVFNTRCAYIGDVDMYVYYNPSSNEIQFVKESQLKSQYRKLYYTKIVKKEIKGGTTEKEVPSPFIVVWMDSEYGAAYMGGACCKPPPLRCKKDQFNLFTGWRVDETNTYDEEINKMSKKEMEEGPLKFLLQHLKYLSGEDQTEAAYEYQLKYFAHLLKHPAVLPRVSILWLSVPRVGKNQFLNFLENIMGSKYYHSSASSRDILGDFNDVIRGKMLLNLNEFKNGWSVMEALKELITETKQSIREKHKNTIRIENYIRVIIASNLKHPLNIEYKDGRFVVFRCNPITTTEEFKEIGYMNTLHQNISSLYIQKCFLRYCRRYVNVVETYNFELNMVKTQEYRDLQARSIPYEIRFFRYWLNNYSKDFYKDSKRLFSYKDTLKQKQIWALFNKFQTSENEKLGYITQSVFINDMDKHRIRDSGAAYLRANNSHIINISKTNQKLWAMDAERCKAFFEDEGVDYDIIDSIDSESEDDDEDDEDDE